MNIEAIICLMLAGFFGIVSIIFALLKEKGAMLISGFNTMPKDEREKYDKEKMSIYMRNSLFLWSIILFSGAILGYFISKYCAIIAIVIWLIVFLKGVQIDSKKAFAKYRKQ